jgi:hypothetical protein
MTPEEIVKKHVIRQVYFSDSEISEYFQPKQDYKSACMSINDKEFHVDRDKFHNKYFWWQAYAIEFLLERTDKIQDQNNESGHMFFSEQEAWRDCARSNQIVSDEVEVLEVWMVSDWLYDRLEHQNESVIRWKGLPLWGGTVLNLHDDPILKEISVGE